MSYRNYNETDLSFYSEKEVEDIVVDYTSKGNVISWPPVSDMAGYAIYRGKGDGWHLLETVGESVTSFMDHEPMSSLLDYKVSAIVDGDIFFGEAETVYDYDGNLIKAFDLKLTADHESAKQDVTNRLRSQKGQWRSHPEIGADLELLEGQPNTRETGNKGIEMITEALAFDNRFWTSDFTVRPVPTSVTNVDYYVIVDSEEKEPMVLKQPVEM